MDLRWYAPSQLIIYNIAPNAGSSFLLQMFILFVPFLTLFFILWRRNKSFTYSMFLTFFFLIIYFYSIILIIQVAYWNFLFPFHLAESYINPNNFQCIPSPSHLGFFSFWKKKVTNTMKWTNWSFCFLYLQFLLNTCPSR